MNENGPQYGIPDAADASTRTGWLARQSMARRIILATLAVTVLVMGAMIAITAYRDSGEAKASVQREMRGALAVADESLQLIFKHASTRAGELMPVLQRALGGLPMPDGTLVPTGEAGSIPRLVAGGRQINGDDATL